VSLFSDATLPNIFMYPSLLDMGFKIPLQTGAPAFMSSNFHFLDFVVSTYSNTWEVSYYTTVRRKWKQLLYLFPAS
jgi:hypothetical protein